MSETYVSVDVEADGPIPGKYSMSSLGAVELANGTTFYRELVPISDQFVPEAAAVSGLDRGELFRTGTMPGAAMQDFVAWVRGLPGRPVFCSFSTWDWMFVYWYLMTYVGESPFGHSSLDMKSFYMGRYHSDWRGTGKHAIAKRNPWLLEGLGPHTHNALDDAKEQGELFRRMLDGTGR